MNRAGLEALYADLAPALSVLAEPWCVIGSAAMMIAGAPIEDCPDLDVLTTSAGAAALEAAWAARRDRDHAPGSSGLFRSRFSANDFPAGRVEVMGDLMLLRDGAWTPLAIPPVVATPFAGGTVGIAGPADQIALFELFGRPKDLVKAEVLRRFGG